MDRYYLNIKKSYNDIAKKNNCRWDSSKKMWYIPGNLNRSPIKIIAAIHRDIAYMDIPRLCPQLSEEQVKMVEAAEDDMKRTEFVESSFCKNETCRNCGSTRILPLEIQTLDSNGGTGMLWARVNARSMHPVSIRIHQCLCTRCGTIFASRKDLEDIHNECTIDFMQFVGESDDAR